MEAIGENYDDRVNKKILIKKEHFSSSKGIFVDTYRGDLTNIVKRFNAKA